MAAQTVTATLKCTLSIAETLTTGLSSVNASSDLIPSFSWVSGNSATANAINQYFCNSTNTITLNSGANTTVTLTSLTDASGASRSFANGVRGLVVYVTSRSANSYLLMGNAAANTWTGFISVNTATVKITDFLAVSVANTDTLAVNATSNQVKFLNVGNSAITFKLAVFGNT